MYPRESNAPKHVLRAAVALAVIAGSALSQSQVLEEVIVTAQKREQSIQDVPITVAVVSGENLERYSINNATDLARSIPGLTVMPAPQGLASPKIRGLGTGSGSESVDQSVGLFIDGIWSGRPRDLQAGLFDIERIEVIKGTQTSQLGKNTSLGAIQVFSKRPESESGGYVQGDYDLELDSATVSGAGNLATALGDYRLSVNYVDEQGYVDNTFTGVEGPEREQLTLRLGGFWNLAQRGELFASYNYDEQEVLGEQFEISSDPQGWYSELTGDTDVRLDGNKKSFIPLRNDGTPYDEQTSHRALVEFTYKLSGSIEFVSLTAYSEYENKRYYDLDISLLDLLYDFQDSRYQQFSQELRMSGNALDYKLDYLIGLYYLDSNYERSTDSYAEESDYLPLAPPVYGITGPVRGAGSNLDQDVESWSVFAHGTYHFAERFYLTLGLRYTDESREADWERFRAIDESALVIQVDAENDIYLPIPDAPTLYEALQPGFAPVKLLRDEDNLDGSLNLQYDFSNWGSVYASWARGSKSGGFDTQASAPDEAEFETEEAETTEIGFKSEWLDGAARLNAAIFFTEIEDFQSVIFVGDAFETETIPVESKGAEFDGLLAVTEQLVLGLAVTYADAENTNTELALQGSPKWSASLSASHVANIGANFQLLGNAVVNYRDEMYTQTSETYEIPAMTLVDLRVALAPTGGNWELALMARNLFDKREDQFGFAFPLFGETYGTSFGSYNRPRTVSLQARYDF